MRCLEGGKDRVLPDACCQEYNACKADARTNSTPISVRGGSGGGGLPQSHGTALGLIKRKYYDSRYRPLTVSNNKNGNKLDRKDAHFLLGILMSLRIVKHLKNREFSMLMISVTLANLRRT